MGLKVILCLFLVGVFVNVIITKITDSKNKKKEQALKNRCSCQVNAVCVDRYKIDNINNRKEHGKCFVIWEFMLCNQVYTVESEVKPENFAEIGEHSILYVNPYNIQEYIKIRTVKDEERFKVVQRNALLFLLFCVVFSLVGVIAIYSQ